MAAATATKQTAMKQTAAKRPDADQAAKEKGARRRRRLFLLVVGGFSLWAAVSFREQNTAMTEKMAEMEHLEQQREQLQLQNEAYQLEVTRLNDNEYIEQKVRKDFGMARPGDKVFETPAEQ